ncbi:MAG: response regulator transcription factor [Anaerolineae bacterium]|nr:response regulator transcription factor [Anaerolineae bacterium]
MSKIRVLLADDHTIVRDGICALLEGEPDMNVVGAAKDGREAIQLACALQPDVVLMDVVMPGLNGLEATRQLRREQPQIQILVLSMHEDEEYVRQMLAAGASGYVLKDAAARDLLGAIRAVHRGEAVLSPAVTRLVLEDYLRWADLNSMPEESCLTPREREVLQLIAEGHTNRQIAGILCLSIKTVQSHRANLMHKLGLHDRGELIKYAIQKKIIEI